MSAQNILRLLLLTIVCFQVGTSAARTWEDKSGRTLEAEYLLFADGKVVIKRDSDGKVYRIPLELLSEADQKFVKEQVAMKSAPAKQPSDKYAGAKAGEQREVTLPRDKKMKLIWCPAGEFLMGTPQDEQVSGFHEIQLPVTLTTGFWLGQTEVTQGQWKAMLGTEPWKDKMGVKEGDTYVASCITHAEALEFCQQLTQAEIKAGRLNADWKFTLPTEAQWEYACRAGTHTAYYFGKDATQLNDYAWWGAFNSGSVPMEELYPHEVGKKKPNAWGFYDMAGNVLEWCSDFESFEITGGEDPQGAAEGTKRIVKGGGWGHPATFSRSAFRAVFDPEQPSSLVGFRVALVPAKK